MRALVLTVLTLTPLGLGAFTGANATPLVEVEYAYQESEPYIVNGKPHRDYKYWACVKEVRVTFDEPVRVPTLKGKLVFKGRYLSDRPLALVNMDDDFQTFTWAPGGKGVCYKRIRHDTLVMNDGALLVNGGRVPGNISYTLNFPEGRNSSPGRSEVRTLSPSNGSVSSPRRVRTPPRSRYSRTTESRKRLDGHSGGRIVRTESVDHSHEKSRTFTKAPVVLANRKPTNRIDPEALNYALLNTHRWHLKEARSPLYRSERLHLLPIDDLILEPRGNTNRERHYGRPDVLYVVRRAAAFVQELFPNLGAIGVADLSTAHGETPYTVWPNGEKQYLHPEGSHEGDDVDIGYISVGAGNDKKQAVDVERSFWLLYEILRSPGVDLVFTAHKKAFVEYAKEAARKGWINQIAVGRVASARVIEDTHLNHDTHMHIRVNYRDNQGQSLRFRPADDAYSCMIGLEAAQKSENNFCLN